MKSEKDTRPIIVSIKCFTYNHEKYIRDALEGFVMQQTNFRFEIIVHDDASTDGTAKIIRKYAEKHPKIIKPIYEKENLYSKHDGSLRRVMDVACQGKYIALCEGDDYWTDPLKLQKQVDFLESHPDYVMCAHRYKMYHQKDSVMDPKVYPQTVHKEGMTVDLNYYIQSKDWIIQPLTVMYRKNALKNRQIYTFKYWKDVSMFYFLLKEGKCFVSGDCDGVYRLHPEGIYSLISYDKKLKGGLDTINEICMIEKDRQSVLFLKSYLDGQLPNIGISFLFRKSTVNSALILIRHLEVNYILKVFFLKFINAIRNNTCF